MDSTLPYILSAVKKNPPSYIEFHTHIVVGETINGTAILLQDKELDACVCVCVC